MASTTTTATTTPAPATGFTDPNAAAVDPNAPIDLGSLWGVSTTLLGKPINSVFTDPNETENRALHGLPVTGVPGTTSLTSVGDVLAKFYAIPPDQLQQLQVELFNGGFYAKTFYSANAKPPTFGAPDDDSYSAFRNAVIAAARSGSTVDDTIQTQINARSANGADPQIDPNTGTMSGGSITKPITIPSIIERGGKYNLNLTSPDEVALIADQVGQKLIGRNLTDTEKKSVTDAIHSQETTKFNADVNSAEGQRQEQYQARVDARNEQFAGSMPGSSGGGSTVGLGLVAPFAGFNLGNSYQHDDQGVDMQTAVGTPVLAAASGHIEIHHDPNGFGPNYAVLILDTPIKGNTGIYYGHVAPDVADGTHVDAGQQIAHTQPGGPQAGNATQDGWLEMGFWGPKGPTGDGAAMHEVLGAPGGGAPTTGPQATAGVGAGGSIKDFATAVLTQLGITPNAENVKAFAAWQRAEGGTAAFNPLNTTQEAQGATAVNGVGVKNYTSFDQGVQATVQTLQNGRYQPIINALKSGNATDVAAAVGSSPWGTNGDLMKQVLAGGVDVNAVPPNLASGQPPTAQAASGTVGTDQYIPASVTSTVNPDSPQAASEAYVKQNDQPEYQAHQLVSAYDTFQQIMQSKAQDTGAARPMTKA